MSNCLILSTGKRYSVIGQQHNIYCRRVFKMSLKQFLQTGGIRVKTHGEHIAIESAMPFNAEQKRTIKRILKEGMYFSMVVCIGGRWAKKDKYRPIRDL